MLRRSCWTLAKMQCDSYIIGINPRLIYSCKSGKRNKWILSRFWNFFCLQEILKVQLCHPRTLFHQPIAASLQSEWRMPACLPAFISSLFWPVSCTLHTENVLLDDVLRTSGENPKPGTKFLCSSRLSFTPEGPFLAAWGYTPWIFGV